MNDEDFYKHVIDMFGHPGWKAFQEDFEERRNNLIKTSFDSTETESQYQRVKGNIEVYKLLLNYEEGIKLGYEVYLKEKEDENNS